MHLRLQSLADKARQEFNRKVQAYEWADETLERLGLAPLLSEAGLVVVRTQYDGTLYANLYFSPEQKSDVLPILTDSGVDKWQRMKMLSRDDNWNGDGRYHDYLYLDWDYYDEDHNRVTVRFVHPVQEGDEVEGCTIKNHAITIDRLALACEATL